MVLQPLYRMLQPVKTKPAVDKGIFDAKQGQEDRRPLPAQSSLLAALKQKERQARVADGGKREHPQRQRLRRGDGGNLPAPEPHTRDYRHGDDDSRQQRTVCPDDKKSLHDPVRLDLRRQFCNARLF